MHEHKSHCGLAGFSGYPAGICSGNDIAGTAGAVPVTDATSMGTGGITYITAGDHSPLLSLQVAIQWQTDDHSKL